MSYFSSFPPDKRREGKLDDEIFFVVVAFFNDDKSEVVPLRGANKNSRNGGMTPQILNHGTGWGDLLA